jgi:hypothetical protein
VSVRALLAVHRPENGPEQLAPREYLLRQLHRVHGLDRARWPFEVGCHMHRVARTNVALNRQVMEFVEEMRVDGWDLVMMQGHLEDGPRLRFRRAQAVHR